MAKKGQKKTTALVVAKPKESKLVLQKTWLSENQLIKMMQRTPQDHIYKRPGKGGQDFEYVTGVYIKKVLNWVTGWNWDFVIEKEEILGLQIVVRGRLVVRDPSGKHEIVKTQYGRAEIKFKRDATKTPENYVDIGNDFKAAATDCLKKCASELGIASDIYGKNEFKEIRMEQTTTANEPVMVSSETIDQIDVLIKEKKIEEKMVKAILKKYKVGSFAELTEDQGKVIVQNLINQK